MQVIAVPNTALDLDPEHAVAWTAALAHAATIARLVPVDIEPFLAAARLLYEAPFVAERLAAFGHLLTPDGPHLDPTVRQIVLGAQRYSAADAFAGQHELARLAKAAAPVFVAADALLLPVTPGHPTLAEVAADPIGANARLGTYTNMANLLDLCAIALPAGSRPDGLPFGIQLLAPAFADRPLLDLAARWTGEPDRVPPVAASRTLLAVAGAHLTGQPANGALVDLGGRLYTRAHTAGGYRMFTVPGPFPRPGLIHTGDGPPTGIEVEVWDLPTDSVARLMSTIAEPLHLGPLTLDNGETVTGFLADRTCAIPTADITAAGGWRAHLTGNSPRC
jgi:allophanate hydrolase